MGDGCSSQTEMLVFYLRFVVTFGFNRLDLPPYETLKILKRSFSWLWKMPRDSRGWIKCPLPQGGCSSRASPACTFALPDRAARLARLSGGPRRRAPAPDCPRPAGDRPVAFLHFHTTNFQLVDVYTDNSHFRRTYSIYVVPL